MSVIRFVDPTFLEGHFKSTHPFLSPLDSQAGTLSALSGNSLNSLLVPRPAATFLMVAEGHDMAAQGVHHGDLLVVDRSVKPTEGRFVVAPVWDELRVCLLQMTEGRFCLECGSQKIKDDELSIWGVITSIIRQV
jgi:DNA polymerase V